MHRCIATYSLKATVVSLPCLVGHSHNSVALRARHRILKKSFRIHQNSVSEENLKAQQNVFSSSDEESKKSIWAEPHADWASRDDHTSRRLFWVCSEKESFLLRRTMCKRTGTTCTSTLRSLLGIMRGIIQSTPSLPGGIDSIDFITKYISRCDTAVHCPNDIDGSTRSTID